MIPATDIEHRTLGEPRDRIAATRRSPDWEPVQLGEGPALRARLEEAKGRVPARSPRYLAWGAVTAIATGLWLAARGLRGRRSTDLYVSPDHPALEKSYGRAWDSSI